MKRWMTLLLALAILAVPSSALFAEETASGKDAPKAAGQDRIWVAGEKEFETIAKFETSGVPIHPQSVGTMRHIAGELGIPYTLD